MATMETIQQTLQTLYTSKSPQAREQANEALQTFQKTVRPNPPPSTSDRPSVGDAALRGHVGSVPSGNGAHPELVG